MFISNLKFTHDSKPGNKTEIEKKGGIEEQIKITKGGFKIQKAT